MATAVINTNYLSLIAQRNLAIHSSNVKQSLEKMSTGERINHASDDTAGLTISETLIGDIRAMQKARQNIQDGKSILQISEGTLDTVVNNLQRIRELTVQAANDTNADVQRDAIEEEIKNLLTDIDRLVETAQFNDKQLLTGPGAQVSLRIHIGPDSNVLENTVNLDVALQDSRANALSVLGAGTNTGWLTANDVDFTDNTIALDFLTDVDNAIDQVNTRRAAIGALENQLDNVTDNLTLRINNFQQSNSNIRDLDIAEEMSKLVRSQILEESSMSILIQANQNDSGVLRLLDV